MKPVWSSEYEGRRTIRAVEHDAMDEVKRLIRFYEKRHRNWLDAAEFVLAARSGAVERSKG